MQDRFGGRDNDDGVGTHERRVDSKRYRARGADLDQVLSLDVVHLDVTVEAPRELGRYERLQLLVARPACESPGDEKRLVAGGNAEAFELAHRCGNRGLARISLGSRKRQLRRFDHDRDACAARDERLERLAGEREAQRVANGCADVRDRVGGRRRPQHQRIVGCGHDDEARPGEQRDPGHGRCR